MPWVRFGAQAAASNDSPDSPSSIQNSRDTGPTGQLAEVTVGVGRIGFPEMWVILARTHFDTPTVCGLTRLEHPSECNKSSYGTRTSVPR